MHAFSVFVNQRKFTTNRIQIECSKLNEFLKGNNNTKKKKRTQKQSPINS